MTPGATRARALAALGLLPGLLGLSGCRSEPAPPPAVVEVARPVGSWRGVGNQTIGFSSESGRFRVAWETRATGPAAADGPFRLAVHSGVSGRPIQLVTDHRGSATGSALVHDDPRLYNLMVESAGVEWSIAVEEYVAGYAPPP